MRGREERKAQKRRPNDVGHREERGSQPTRQPAAGSNKERFDLEEQCETSEHDCAAAQADATVLEAQFKKKIETEQSLASQVSVLASQLASSASSSSEATSAYQK